MPRYTSDNRIKINHDKYVQRWYEIHYRIANLPFSTFGMSGASCGRLFWLESCCNCPLGAASFSASNGFAAAIVNFRDLISTITCAFFWWLLELLTECSVFEFGMLLFSSCCNNDNYKYRILTDRDRHLLAVATHF